MGDNKLILHALSLISQLGKSPSLICDSQKKSWLLLHET